MPRPLPQHHEPCNYEMMKSTIEVCFSSHYEMYHCCRRTVKSEFSWRHFLFAAHISDEMKLFFVNVAFFGNSTPSASGLAPGSLKALKCLGACQKQCRSRLPSTQKRHMRLKNNKLLSHHRGLRLSERRSGRRKTED